MRSRGATQLVGDTNFRVFSGKSLVPSGDLTVREVLKYGFPGRGNTDLVNQWRLNNIKNLWRGWKSVILADKLNLATFFGRLDLRKIPADWRESGIEEYGLAGYRVVTTAGVNFIVDAFQNAVELEIMKYHAIGTSSTAEAVGDTALGVETALYSPTTTIRATGSLDEGATANIYKTVGTNTVSGAVAAVEHGILSQASTAGGVLLDRTVFTVINLGNGDSLQSTYELTVSAGG